MNVRVEAVRILLAKAAQDGLAARQLAADARIGDEVVGFHIQQAAEKGLRVPNKTPTRPRESQVGCTARRGPQGDAGHRSRALTPRGAHLAFSLRARAGGRRDAASRSSRVVPATRLLAFLASLARRPSRGPVGVLLGTLKALLTSHGIPYRRTHDLVELMDLLIAQGHAVPAAIEPIQELTPFAVEYRYETLDQYEDVPLDRNRALALLEGVEAWVREHIRAG